MKKHINRIYACLGASIGVTLIRHGHAPFDIGHIVANFLFTFIGSFLITSLFVGLWSLIKKSHHKEE